MVCFLTARPCYPQGAYAVHLGSTSVAIQRTKEPRITRALALALIVLSATDDPTAAAAAQMMCIIHSSACHMNTTQTCLRACHRSTLTTGRSRIALATRTSNASPDSRQLTATDATCAMYKCRLSCNMHDCALCADDAHATARPQLSGVGLYLHLGSVHRQP